MHGASKFGGILVVGLFLLAIVSTAAAKYSGGTDEPNGPYQSTAADLTAFGETALPQTYYVAPEGLDSGPGTRAHPWQTIGHAAQTIDSGDTVVVMDGVYRVSDPLEFGPAGESYARMTTYRSEEGARAVFSAADGRPPGVWMADYVRVDGLWFGGKWEPPESYGAYIGVGGGGNPIGRGKQLVHCTMFGYNDGILIGQSENLLIQGNRLVHTGAGSYQHGIYLSGGYPPGACSNHVIVDDNILIVGEGWAIHGWHNPRSMIITRNFVHSHWGGIVMSGSEHVIANNFLARLDWGATDFYGNTVVVNNVLWKAEMGGFINANYVAHNAFLEAEPRGLAPLVLGSDRAEADLGISPQEIDDAVAQLAGIFEGSAEAIHQDERIEPLFAKLRTPIPSTSCLRNAGKAWYQPGRDSNVGPDSNQPASLDTLWYAFREWGLKDWNLQGVIFQPKASDISGGRAPDPRDNDRDGVPNDADPDDDNDGAPDVEDVDRDGDLADDTSEILLACDPDDRASVPPLTPLLEANRTALELKSVVGRNPPAPETLRLRNRGMGTLDWRATVSASWIELNVEQGSLGVGDRTALTAAFVTQALPQGSYTTDLTLTYDDKTVIIPVHLTVVGQSATKEGLLHHWTLDEGEGQIAHDPVRAADVVIPWAQWVAGADGAALQFDGVDDYVEFPGLMADYSQFTVALWFKTAVSGTPQYTGDSFSDNTMWQRYMTPGADGGEMSLATVNGRLRGEFNLVQRGDARPLYSEALVADDQWHHAAMTISAKDRVVLFLDGRQVDERNIGDDATTINASHQDGNGIHSIGRTVWWLATMYYTGAIDDIRLYDRPLSSAEIDALFCGYSP